MKWSQHISLSFRYLKVVPWLNIVKVLEHLRGKVLLKKLGHWGLALIVISDSFPDCSLLPELRCNVNKYFRILTLFLH